MVKALEAYDFGGSRIALYPHGPDVEVQVDGSPLGVYLSAAAARVAAEKHVIGKIEADALEQRIRGRK